MQESELQLQGLRGKQKLQLLILCQIECWTAAVKAHRNRHRTNKQTCHCQLLATHTTEDGASAPPL